MARKFNLFENPNASESFAYAFFAAFSRALLNHRLCFKDSKDRLNTAYQHIDANKIYTGGKDAQGFTEFYVYVPRMGLYPLTDYVFSLFAGRRPIIEESQLTQALDGKTLWAIDAQKAMNDED